MSAAAQDDAALVAELRKKGLVGPISRDFLDQIRADREFTGLLDQLEAAVPDGLNAFKRALVEAGLITDPDAAWIAAKTDYLAKRAAARAYDAVFIDPYVSGSLPIGPERHATVDAIPKENFEESERLTDLELAAETALMEAPSPDLGAFAFKVVIARGEGRDLNGYDDMLVAEARRLAKIDVA